MKKIKVTFIALAIFFFFLHFLGPTIFYWIFGYGPTYQDEIFDLSAMKLGFFLNLMSLLVSCGLIWITPNFFQNEKMQNFLRNEKVQKIFLNEKVKSSQSSYIYFLLSVFFTIGVFLTNMDYRSAIHFTRSDYWVLGEMFFNLDFYIIFAMIYSYNFIVESVFIYILVRTLAGIRSAPLSLLHYFICSFGSLEFNRYKKKYFIYLMIAVLFSIFGFSWATKLREGEVSKGKITLHEMKVSSKINSNLIYKIVGRFSYLENTMLPIHYKNVDDKSKMEIYREKYSVTHQMKIFINNLVPGDIFTFDVYPNQYYRAAFLGMPLQQAKEVYTSINLTLPVFIYMSSGVFTACIFTALIVWGYYIITSFLFQINNLLGVSLLVLFYPGLLTFFDFVMFGKSIVMTMFAALLFLVIGNIESRLFTFFRGIRK